MKIILKADEAIQKYDSLKKEGHILFECIVGSQAYGTNLPSSDIDKKFVYIETLENILKNTASSQLLITDDYVGFELAEFLQLLAKQSPNIHELIWSPEDMILYCSDLFKQIIISNRENFISKRIRFSFAEYAEEQIKKARGLNKKIVNPIPKKRKGPLDFCWVPDTKTQGSKNINDWLNEHGLKQEYCGLVSIDHMKYTYHLFYDFPAHAQDIKIDSSDEMLKFCQSVCDNSYFYKNNFDITPIGEHYKWISSLKRFNYKGILQKEKSNTVCLSSIEKGMKPLTIMYFNQEGYTKYCKDYKEYWNWVENRNEERFQTNLSHGAQYDSKNMMHCHRLLDTCIEALIENKINVRRKNREQLLEIRQGKYLYENLIEDAASKIETIKQLYEETTIPEDISKEFYLNLLMDFRNKFYF